MNPEGAPAPTGSWFRVTGRSGGVSDGPYRSLNLADHVGDDPAAVAANRERAAGLVGLTGADLVVMMAEHGRTAHRVTAPGPPPPGDILVTTDPAVALMALAADCVPLALCDPGSGVVAAVHSGWRGVAADAAGAAVAAMVAAGAAAPGIRAHLGPAICPDCYEVSDAVRDEVARAAPDAAATTRSGTPGVALHRGVTLQLRRSGVTDITADDSCTAESPDLFSYRRDGVTGRQGIVVRLPGAGS